MAFDSIVSRKSLVSAATLASQFVFVTINASGQAALPSAGGNAIGVTQDTPNAGDPTFVCGPGDITKVLCSATIAAGQKIGTDANGNAIPCVTGDLELGYAISAGSAGFLADILFQPVGVTRVAGN